MSETSTNRERAVPYRGVRGYFRRPTMVGAWKVRLGVLALLGTVGWLAASMIVPGTRYADSTHGPLANPHARFDKDCQACHLPAGQLDGKGGLFAVRDRWHAFSCENCHAGPKFDVKDYAPHFDRSKFTTDAESRDCASCHRDHQGRDFAIAKVDDAACIRCHQNLSGHGSTMAAVTSFVDNHPAFRIPPSQERTLKFSHAHHLSPGIAHSADHAAKSGKKLSDLDAMFREQYRPYMTGDLLTLDCAACHEPTGTGTYKPVSFDKHCQACHGLELSAVTSKQGVTLPPMSLPHGKQPSELEILLRGDAARQTLLKSDLKLDPRPPSDRLDKSTLKLPATLQGEIDAVVKQRMNSLNCGYCHNTTNRPGGFEVIKPTAPPVWLSGAGFNHDKHRTVACVSCHDGKAAAFVGIAERVLKELLAIPGIAKCRECHGPLTTGVKGGTSGGVRHACVDCHKYHHHGSPR